MTRNAAWVVAALAAAGLTFAGCDKMAKKAANSVKRDVERATTNAARDAKRAATKAAADAVTPSKEKEGAEGEHEGAETSD